jgi:hypothetical protein
MCCMAIDKRVQVLMEPGEFSQLEAIAASQGVSLGELIRQAVRERYLTHAEQRLTAAERLCQLDLATIQSEHLDASLMLARSEGLR